MLAGSSKSCCSASLTLVLMVAFADTRAEPPARSATSSAEAAVRDRSLLRLLKYTRTVPLDQLQSALRHENPEVRRLALQRWSWGATSDLAPGKPLRDSDRQRLFAALQDSDPGVRSMAAQLVGERERQDVSIATRLAEMLRTDSADVRVAAAAALGRSGQTSPEIHSSLSAAAREEGELAAQAIVALLALDSDRGVVALRNADDATRMLVAKSLTVHEITEVKDRAFLLLLSDSRPEIRRQVLENLDLDRASRDVVIWQTLQGLLDPDPAVRGAASSNLHGRFELETPDEFARATRLIMKMPADSPHRDAAWICLKKPVEEQTGSALKFLRDAEQDERLRIELAGILTRCESLSDDDLETEELATEIEQIALDARVPLAIRVAAAETLCGYHLSPRDDLPKSDDEYAEQFRPLFIEGVNANIFLPMRLMALHHMVVASHVDESARRVIDELFQREWDQHRSTRGSARWRGTLLEAAYNSRPKEQDVTPLLSLGLRDADVGIRRFSAGLLRNAVSNRRFVPDETMLLSLLDDEDLETRRTALQVTTERGPKTAAVTTQLLKLLDDSDSALRHETARAWKRLGADVSPVVNRLLERLALAEQSFWNEPHSPQSKMFREGMEILLDVSPEDPRVVAAVLRTLNREDRLTEGLMWLPKLGPAGREALPTLLALLEEPYEGLVIPAANAISYLGPVARPVLPKLRGMLADPESDVAKAVAKSVLRLEPTNTTAQDIVAKTILAEFQMMWCWSAPPAWSCVLSLKKEGLPTLRKVLLTPADSLIGSPLESLLSGWENTGQSREYDFLEPLLREFLEESDSPLGQRFRTSLKRRSKPAQSVPSTPAHESPSKR